MANKILLLGANGFLGSNIMQSLIARGAELRVLVRDGSNGKNLEGWDVEEVVGDLADHPSLLEAMAGCDYVFHTAAFYPLYSNFDEDEEKGMRQIRNLLSAAKALKIKRLVYTSSLSTIGQYPKGGPMSDEKADYHLKKDRSSYFNIKWKMEQEVLAMSPKGLDVVVVNPTACYGPGDIKPTSGKVIVDIANRKMPAMIDAPINIVDVRDVAESHVAAFEKGKRGERYILGGTNTTTVEFAEIVARLTGVKPPKFKVPMWLAEFGAGLSENWDKSIFHREEPRIPISGVDLMKHSQHLSDAKARRELGHSSRPLKETLADSVAWFRKTGMIG